MSDRTTTFRDRLARRGFLYLLVAVGVGGIVLLRQQARGIEGERHARAVAASSLVHDAQGTLAEGQRYRLEVVGDRRRLERLTLSSVRVIAVDARATSPFVLDARGSYERPEGSGRVRRRLGTFTAPRDGDVVVRLDLTPPLAEEFPDSLFVYAAPRGEAFSRSFGMMAVGAVVFLVILAIGAIVGRSFLDTDAT